MTEIIVVLPGRYVNEINQKYGVKVWITEMACSQPNGGVAGQVSYMRQAMSVLDNNPAVERCGPAAPRLCWCVSTRCRRRT